MMFRTRPTAAYLQLSQEEKEQFWAEQQERHSKAGAKSIILLDTYWSSEKWHFAGVSEFEDIETLQYLEQMQNDAEIALYMTSEIMLGTKADEA